MSAVAQPTFSKDGKYLFFIASTNTGLTNSGLHMSAYERNPQYNVYAFILSKKTPSLFKNESDEETVKEDKVEEPKKEEKVAEKKDNKKKTDAKEDVKQPAKPVEKKLEVDFDDINSRIVALPLPAGYYRLDGSVENMLTYQRGGSIGAFDLTKMEDKALVDNARGLIGRRPRRVIGQGL